MNKEKQNNYYIIVSNSFLKLKMNLEIENSLKIESAKSEEGHERTIPCPLARVGATTQCRLLPQETCLLVKLNL